MRYFLLFWLLPVGGLLAWLGLASHDINFGTLFFSRDMYDLVFAIYGDVLGMDPATIPPLLYKALAVDTLIVGALVAFRKRAALLSALRNWRNQRDADAAFRARYAAFVAGGQVPPAE